MRKIMTAALAAITVAGAVAATAAPAEARDYRGGYGGQRYYGHRGGNDAGVAIAAGVVGLALGAAIAGNNSGGYSNGYARGGYPSSYYDGGYPRGGYDGYYSRPGYGYEPAYRTCVSRDRIYDPYIGRRVVVTRRYAC